MGVAASITPDLLILTDVCTCDIIHLCLALRLCELVCGSYGKALFQFSETWGAVFLFIFLCNGLGIRIRLYLVSVLLGFSCWCIKSFTRDFFPFVLASKMIFIAVATVLHYVHFLARD